MRPDERVWRKKMRKRGRLRHRIVRTTQGRRHADTDQEGSR